MKEIWRDIKGYEGLYQVSNLGRVKRIQSFDSIGRKKKGQDMSNHKCHGYLRVWLSKDNNRKSYSIHRLVAEAFISNPENKPEVNHIDGNKENNCVENLEWCTRSENIKHGYSKGLLKQTSRRRNDYRSKKVVQKSNGIIIHEYPSAMEAQRQTGYSQGTISNCCRGNQKIAYGYEWSYKTE